MIRPGRDADAAGFIALIGGCWAEYPGCVMDVDGEVPELRALASHYAGKGGALWSAEEAGRIVGVIAAWPEEPGIWEIGRMYVARAERGTGLADALLDRAEAHAIAAGAARLQLWSDTRFERAHRFYERRSYVRTGPIRALNDRSNSIEFHYAKPVHGIERLDAAAAASAERPLAEVLCACVEAGASVSFLPPLPLGTARTFWRRYAAEVAGGKRIILAAWADGVLRGVVTLGLDTPQNQPHRADVQKLLVHPAARRRGLGRALMELLEQEAAAAGRTLLTLDTNEADDAERLYRALGWTEAGRFPDYAVQADGSLRATVLFYKRTGGPGT
ncbi:MAG TPA: GNAT family N-acetyltransferase [Acetobacteraceae bacterium]|nr:GNAT family N-acetyltransferase [Acetobacteraceae bacterium]